MDFVLLFKQKHRTGVKGLCLNELSHISSSGAIPSSGFPPHWALHHSSPFLFSLLYPQTNLSLMSLHTHTHARTNACTHAHTQLVWASSQATPDLEAEVLKLFLFNFALCLPICLSRPAWLYVPKVQWALVSFHDSFLQCYVFLVCTMLKRTFPNVGDWLHKKGLNPELEMDTAIDKRQCTNRWTNWQKRKKTEPESSHIISTSYLFMLVSWLKVTWHSFVT